MSTKLLYEVTERQINIDNKNYIKILPVGMSLFSVMFLRKLCFPPIHSKTSFSFTLSIYIPSSFVKTTGTSNAGSNHLRRNKDIAQTLHVQRKDVYKRQLQYMLFNI